MPRGIHIESLGEDIFHPSLRDDVETFLIGNEFREVDDESHGALVGFGDALDIDIRVESDEGVHPVGREFTGIECPSFDIGRRPFEPRLVDPEHLLVELVLERLVCAGGVRRRTACQTGFHLELVVDVSLQFEPEPQSRTLHLAVVGVVLALQTKPGVAADLEFLLLDLGGNILDRLALLLHRCFEGFYPRCVLREGRAYRFDLGVEFLLELIGDCRDIGGHLDQFPVFDISARFTALVDDLDYPGDRNSEFVAGHGLIPVELAPFFTFENSFVVEVLHRVVSPMVTRDVIESPCVCRDSDDRR